MTPQELKASILQLAIQGKLVEQRPEEGTGGELLWDILTQRRRGAECAEKKLTRRRGDRGEKADAAASFGPGCPVCPSSPVPPADAPFDIPESWVWVRIKDIATKITDGTHHSPPNLEHGDFMYVTAKNIKDQGVLLSNISYVSSTVHEEIFARCNPELGDILLIKDVATTGVVTVNNLKEPFSLLSSVALLKMPKSISAWYLVYVLRSDLFYKAMRAQMKGTGITRVTLKQIENFLIPLPPLAEQKRIVAKIEELLPYIDRYEKAWSKLEDFNKRFPGDMQKSLLQMAIQGKLVDQRPEEGTGEELLDKILATKNTKGTKKNSRAETRRRGERAATALPREEIPDDEKPLDIPESWAWVRLGEVGSWGAGATPSRTHAEYFGGSIPWLKTGDLNDGYVSSIPETITDLALEKTSVRLNPVGSVLMAMYGATIGKLGILQIAATTNQACCACIPYDGVWNKYLFYYLMARRKAFIKMGEGGAQPNISKEKIVNALIPLPPLAEQKRIVAKLEELLPLCERLK